MSRNANRRTRPATFADTKFLLDDAIRPFRHLRAGKNPHGLCRRDHTVERMAGGSFAYHLQARNGARNKVCTSDREAIHGSAIVWWQVDGRN